MLQILALSIPMVIPFEYVIDCSLIRGNGRTKLYYRCECWDGKVLDGEIVTDNRASPGAVIDAFALIFNANEWRYKRIGIPRDEASIAVVGSKTCRIKNITFTTDDWKPIVTRQLALPLPVPPKK